MLISKFFSSNQIFHVMLYKLKSLQYFCYSKGDFLYHVFDEYCGNLSKVKSPVVF